MHKWKNEWMNEITEILSKNMYFSFCFSLFYGLEQKTYFKINNNDIS